MYGTELVNKVPDELLICTAKDQEDCEVEENISKSEENALEETKTPDAANASNNEGDKTNYKIKKSMRMTLI